MGAKQEELSLRVLDIVDGETTRYHLLGQQSQKVSAYLTQVVSKFEEEGRECYKLHTKTQYIEGDMTEETSTLETAGSLRPLCSHRIAKSKSGAVLLDSTLLFDDATLDVPSNAVLPGVDGLSFCLRGCTFVPKKKIAVSAMCIEGTVLRLHGPISTEKVTVPAGTFDCYKVELVGDVMDTMGYKMPPGMGGLVEHFLPTNHYWFSQKEPHYLVKLEGIALSSTGAVHKLPSENEHTIQELLSIETP